MSNLVFKCAGCKIEIDAGNLDEFYQLQGKKIYDVRSGLQYNTGKRYCKKCYNKFSKIDEDSENKTPIAPIKKAKSKFIGLGEKIKEFSKKREDKTTSSRNKNAPIKTFKLKNISVAIWENEEKDGSLTYKLGLKKSYIISRGRWGTTNYLDEDETEIAIELQRQAVEYIQKRKNRF